MLTLNKNIGQLVDEHFVLARALHFLGVDFLEHVDQTLLQLCKTRGIRLGALLQIFDKFNQKEVERLDLKAYPIDLTIGYLKHSHQVFIKEKLPYVAKLINKLDASESFPHLVEDLKIIFPVFLEDFINHIYEEEDSVFRYIMSLHETLKGGVSAVNRHFYLYKEYSIDAIIKEHHDEDEMRGLREMIQTLDHEKCDLHLSTIIKELKAFDLELNHHARIENDVLLPEAAILERKLTDIHKKLTQLN